MQYEIDISKTLDLKYLVLNIESEDTTEERFLSADRPRDSFRMVAPREKKQ